MEKKTKSCNDGDPCKYLVGDHARHLQLSKDYMNCIVQLICNRLDLKYLSRTLKIIKSTGQYPYS